MSRAGVWWRSSTSIGLAFALVGCGESVRHAPSDAADVSDPRARPGQILVVDRFDLPYANTPVLVDATVVTTDANGYATLPDVGTRYDVSVVTSFRAFTFVGLTTRAPIIDVTATTTGNGASSISVAIQLPQELGASQKLVYSAGFSDNRWGAVGRSGGDAHGVSFEADWPGDSPTEFSAEAFIVDVDPVTGAELAFSQYALGTWTVTPGDIVTWIPEFEPVPFETKPIHIDVTLPPDFGIDRYSAFPIERSGRCGATSFAEFGATSFSDPSSGGDVLVLDLPDTTYTVAADAVSNDRATEVLAEADGVQAGDRVTLEMSDGPRQLAPDDGAVVTPDADFTWTKAREAVDVLIVSTGSPSGAFTYVIATAEGTAQIPALSALGTSIPAAAAMNWEVESLNGSTSVDAYAAGVPWHGWGHTRTRRATVAE